MSKYVEIDVELKVVRPLALLVNDGDSDFWVPRACIDEEESTVEDVGDEGALFVEKKFARQEGMV